MKSLKDKELATNGGKLEKANMKIHQDINIEESKNENSGTNKSKIKCIKLLILENITLIDRTKVRK